MTAEANAYYCGVHGDLLAAPRSFRCAQAPAGHEYVAADGATTKTEVRIAYEYGVNSGSESTELHVNVKTTVQGLKDRVERETMGPIEVTKVQTRTVTTICTPWTDDA